MTTKSETSLRPQTLNDFVGQSRIKEALEITIWASKHHNKPFPHTVFHGPAGHGKTTLANIIANEMEAGFTTILGPQAPSDLGSLFKDINSPTIIFIDEIHALKAKQQETLYRIMEDGIVTWKYKGTFDWIYDEANIGEFVTIMGATTEFGSLTKPMRDRFEVQHHLEHYILDDIYSIVERHFVNASYAGWKTEFSQVAMMCRYNPRIVGNTVQRIIEIAEVKADLGTRKNVVTEFQRLYNIDSMGLNSEDHQVLNAIIKIFQGGPVGIEALSSACDVDKNTIKNHIEPYLMRLGFIQRAPRGRQITKEGLQYVLGSTNMLNAQISDVSEEEQVKSKKT